MRAEVMEFYGLARSPRSTDYYETAHHRKLLKDIRQAVYDSDLIALCGVVGSGKTVTLRRLQDMLAEDGRVLVSKSVAVEKDRATLGTLISAHRAISWVIFESESLERAAGYRVFRVFSGQKTWQVFGHGKSCEQREPADGVSRAWISGASADRQL